MKKNYEDILKRRGIYGEPENVIMAVCEMVGHKARELKKEYPYAAAEIKDMEKTEQVLFSFASDVENE